MNFFGKRSVVISFDNGELDGLSPLYSIPFGNDWLAWLSRSWTRSVMSSMRENFGVREHSGFQSPYHLRGSPTNCASSFQRNAWIPEYMVVMGESARFFP